MHCWGQRSCRGQLGSTRGQFAKQCPMTTKFGGKNIWPERNALLGSKVMQGSSGVNQGSNYAIWPPNLVGRIPDQSIMHCWGQKSCRGHPEVKLLRNALWPPNLVGRIPHQSIMHCWVKGHEGVSWDQVKVSLLNNALWPPKFGGKNSWPERNALLWSKVMHWSAKVNQRSNSLEIPCGH